MMINGGVVVKSINSFVLRCYTTTYVLYIGNAIYNTYTMYSYMAMLTR